MVVKQQFERDGPDVRRYEYDDRTVVAADLGPVGDGSVDIVDGTAIVNVDNDQYDIALPDGEARASIRNGIVTVEVDVDQ